MKLGILGRLGLYSALNRKRIYFVWLAIAIVLGFFAPKVEHALSGAGWQQNGSESVQVRDLIDSEFGGVGSTGLMVVISSGSLIASDQNFQSVTDHVVQILKSDDRVSAIVPPIKGQSISRDQHTAIVIGGAGADSNEMVRVADDLKEELTALSNSDTKVSLTGSSAMWSDFNVANRNAMMKSELMSWPVTLAILVLAFGSLMAAGLPLLLTILGLVASAGSLYLLTLVSPISIWAMNFAMMFALALGIDYALFLVYRYRAALFGEELSPQDAVAKTMDTAGKAVLFSGLTVLLSLSAVMIVNSPAFRSMALGIMVSVVFVLAATLTLLPAVLGGLGGRVNKWSLPWAKFGEHRSERFAAWGDLLWRRPWGFGIAAISALALLAIPVLDLKTAMPSIKVVPAAETSRVGYEEVQRQFGVGAPGTLQVVALKDKAQQTASSLAASAGIAGVTKPQPSKDGRYVLLQAIPNVDPSDRKLPEIVKQLREQLPEGSLVGGAAAENIDLETELSNKTPVVIGGVMVLGFLLLLIALQAPLIAAIGVVTNLLATGAAFGLAKLVFQDGKGSSLLGIDPQGFLDAWGPVFFFAMIFAISMDYTVFLLASAKEHWDKSGDPKEAMVGGLAHSGRVIFAAAAVMVAVFFTFSLSGPLPPKEMGIILGFAVLVDAALVRLLLVPVLLRLTGRAAWWLPKWLGRILPNIKFGH